MSNDSTVFPPDFVWGVATSAYQIEGATTEDGRGMSIWDRFCETPGKVRNGETGAIACDFFHRYPEDVALMRELGVDAFRFSIGWPRILPEGRGRVNAAGLDFYDRLVDTLLAADIAPYLTLYHWDLPVALEDAGGWPARATAEAFAELAGVVAARLGDRVHHWITHNEPWVASWLGYGLGVHAPGRTSQSDALAAAHHLLLSHGLATEAIRRESPGAEVGITVDLYSAHPETLSDENIAAATLFDGTRNRWFLDPVLRGTYPEDVLRYFGADAPPVRDGDLRTISTPLDFLGVNNYSRAVVRADEDGITPVLAYVDGAEHDDMGREVYPDGIRELLLRLHREYAVPKLYVTENGASYSDVPAHDGQVNDPERQRYLERYVACVGEAIAAGAPVCGYFVWSLLDNFEWDWGYSRRFGIVYVDYPTLARIPKGSFSWYRGLIQASRLSATAGASAGR